MSPFRRKRQGLLFVMSAPSGAGKTTLCKAVVPQVKNLQYSVSYTTRSPRQDEVHGKDYFFVDLPAFQAMIQKNDFIEWAEVHGNFYGTSRSALQDFRAQGVDVILDIDTQGADALRRNGEGIYIYVLPPSLAVLSERLVGRQSDSEEEIARRLQKSREEILSYRQYDYVVVNGDFQTALDKVKAIISAERVRMGQIDPAWIEGVLLSEPKSV